MAQSARTILEPSRSIPVIGEYAVVVLGGGAAGISAAVAAVRSGCSTLLVERYGFLGGMGTAGAVMSFCGLYANVHGEIRQVVHGVADDLLARIDGLGGLSAAHLSFGKTRARGFDLPSFKIAADDLLLSAGVNILFHALAAGVVMRSEREIEAILVETKSGRGAILGQMFVDCSGDADLAAWAGAPCEQGDGAGNNYYPSMMFRINGVNPERAGNAWEVIPKLMEQAEREGRWHFPRKTAIVRPVRSGIEWRVNMTQIANADGTPVNGIDAAQLSYGEIEGRRQIARVLPFFREVPGFENCYLSDTAPQLGIRQTRRMVGEYQLTAEDVLNCASFDDTIGVNGWMLEKHVKGAIQFIWQRIPESRGFNHLPLRMLVPLKVNNLFVAGRCASMTYEGQSSARVIGPCLVMGQAAGTAAALAINMGCANRSIDIAELQRRLEVEGAYLGRDGQSD